MLQGTSVIWNIGIQWLYVCPWLKAGKSSSTQSHFKSSPVIPCHTLRIQRICFDKCVCTFRPTFPAKLGDPVQSFVVVCWVLLINHFTSQTRHHSPDTLVFELLFCGGLFDWNFSVPHLFSAQAAGFVYPEPSDWPLASTRWCWKQSREVFGPCSHDGITQTLQVWGLHIHATSNPPVPCSLGTPVAGMIFCCS